jgi:regulator of sigma E protease
MISLLAFIVLIGVLITAHEAGHFVVAKLSGVKVHTFSIGFGQALISKTIGDTEYRIALIPLGGYVRLHGMEHEFGDPNLDLNASPALDEIDKESIHTKPPWIKILIFIAGPAMNLILPFFLLPPFYALSSNYDEMYGSVMGSVDQGLPAYQAGFRSGDEIIKINGETIHAFWQVADWVDQYKKGDPPLDMTVKRLGRKDPVSFTVHPEQIESTERFLGFTRTDNRIGFQPFPQSPDLSIQSEISPLKQIGLESFDRVLEINGQAIQAFYEISPLLSQVSNDQPIVLKVERLTSLDQRWTFLNERRALQFTLPPKKEWVNQGWVSSQIDLSHIQDQDLGIVQAGSCISSIDPKSAAAQVLNVGDCLIGVNGERHSLTVFLDGRIRHKPEESKRLLVLRKGKEIEETLILRQEIHSDPLAGEIKYWQMGFTFYGLSRTGSMGKAKRISNTVDRWHFAWIQTKNEVWSEVSRSLMTIGGMFSGAVSPTQLSGPVTIFYLAGQQAQAGFDHFLHLMVLLSLSIAVLNLFPLPGLDGGHILIASIELITRRPLPMRFKQWLQMTGVLLILMLIVFALGNDLLRMWRVSQGG